MKSDLSIALVQDEFLVGDIANNAVKVIEYAKRAEKEGAHLVVFPELCLTGYPPEDLLLRPALKGRIDQAVDTISHAGLDIGIVIGAPIHKNGLLYNAALLISDGQVQQTYFKRHLPNYQVFDEKRYFSEGRSSCVFAVHGHNIGLAICEDVWEDDVLEELSAAQCDAVLVLNASPFHINRTKQRRDLVSKQCQKNQLTMVYVNAHGAQDELVFDGGSMVCDQEGELVYTMPSYQSAFKTIHFDGQLKVAEKLKVEKIQGLEESVYNALVQGLRAYIEKNHFKGIVLGLSGGIDSGLSLAIAVDAIGADRVTAIMMPYAYTSQMSLDDAKEEAELLGVEYKVLPINSLFEPGMELLNPLFEGYAADVTEQNMQARIRGMLLMAVSNKTGYMVLTTGNKSEMAVGYATLYGDMCGGYNALKDVPKMLVFSLSRYRNTLGYVIPQRVIDRPPSAELAPDQKDEDSLPPYLVLDEIIERYVEFDQSAADIIAAGFDDEVVVKILRLIDINEYKRRQAPEGVRITARGFGRDRRYPLCNAWPLIEKA